MEPSLYWEQSSIQNTVCKLFSTKDASLGWLWKKSLLKGRGKMFLNEAVMLRLFAAVPFHWTSPHVPSQILPQVISIVGYPSATNAEGLSQGTNKEENFQL